MIDAHEIRHFALRFFNRIEQKEAAGLRHGLNDQDARHDGMAGEMAREEGLVDGHVLERYHAFPRFHPDYPVDKQKGISMGEDAQDVLDFEDRFGCRRR